MVFRVRVRDSNNMVMVPLSYLVGGWFVMPGLDLQLLLLQISALLLLCN